MDEFYGQWSISQHHSKTHRIYEPFADKCFKSQKTTFQGILHKIYSTENQALHNNIW